jgi:hypothetical protein
MRGTGILKRVLVLAGSAVLVTTAFPAAPVRTASAPKMEAVAETRLLMEGLAEANFHGLERHLKGKPADAETWTFLRGQALLIAETGNLLLMRPPRNKGEEAWMARAADLREVATALARAAGRADYERCRGGLSVLASVCNRCHQTFRVPVRMEPFGEAANRTE